MYSIKFNPLTLDYDVSFNTRIEYSAPTKKDARDYISKKTGEENLTKVESKLELENKNDEPNKTHGSPAAELPKAEEKKPVENANKRPGSVSVFDDILAPTEEDQQAEDPEEESLDGDEPTPDKTEGKIVSLANQAIEDPGDPDEDDEKTKRQNAHLQSLLIVEICSTVVCFSCQWLSDDWTNDGEKKYTISPFKQKALQKPIYMLLMRRKKKTNPVLSLVVAVLLSYAPLFIVAFKSKKEKSLAELEKERERLKNEQFLREMAETKARQNIGGQETEGVKFNPVSNPLAAPFGMASTTMPVEKMDAPILSATKKDGRGRPPKWKTEGYKSKVAYEAAVKKAKVKKYGKAA
jgi:hypothetical protein